MLFANLFLATSALLVGFAAQAAALTLPEHAARGDHIPTNDIAAARSSIDSRANNCANLQGCSKCVANAACGFSKTAFTCSTRSGAANANQVTSNTGCPQMNQMQAVFPAVNAKTKAGIITATVSAEFARISDHIFNGERTSKTSGRHTSDAWLAANPGSVRIQPVNTATHISAFPNGKTGKTVWESAFYSELDIKNMCAVTIALGNNAGKQEGAFVVQTPFGKPACIHHFKKGTGSCFPLGTANPTAKLGAPCDVAGEDNDD